MNEHIPLVGINGDAWVPYSQRFHNGKWYRSFLSIDRLNGIFSNYGFPSDGSPALNFKSANLRPLTSTRAGYPSVALNIPSTTAAVGWTRTWLKTHMAVAYLWGAPKKTAFPMSQLVIVDHIEEGNKDNFQHIGNVVKLEKKTKGGEEQRGQASTLKEHGCLCLI